MSDRSIDFARELYLPELPLPKRYRPGKFTAIGPGEKKREVILDVQGEGVLTRLWTTQGHPENRRLFVYVDDGAEPVLSGNVVEIAEAAGRLESPRVPLGGFQHLASSSLYLPIAFARRLRIESEPTGQSGDGPYWQIDYAMGDPTCPGLPSRWASGPLPRQGTDAQGRMTLAYDGPPLPPRASGRIVRREESFNLSGANPHEFRLEGPGVIRRIEITSQVLDSLLLRISFDDAVSCDDRLDGPFQVDAPLRYLVGPFNNAAVERLGSSAVIHWPMPFRRAAGLQLLAGMDYGTFHQQHPVRVQVEYEADPAELERMAYFHARYRCAWTNGRDDFECLSTAGRGHFVGINLFDTGHDHGGGDNILFDAGAETAGQLHGICGEDYFHMAYMQAWNRTPYSGCPSHAARYRYHLEMPVPFHESLVFNWGTFAGQPAKAVAFWYQDEPADDEPPREMQWTLDGPFALEAMGALTPDRDLPAEALAWPATGATVPRRTWIKPAQRGFVDLCHVHRRHLWPVPPSTGWIAAPLCTVARSAVWAADAGEAELWVGCDDAIRVFVNGQCVLADPGRQGPDPFRLMKAPAELASGLNRLFVVVGNTVSSNWLWNGFSLVIKRAKGERGIGVTSLLGDTTDPLP